MALLLRAAGVTRGCGRRRRPRRRDRRAARPDRSSKIGGRAVADDAAVFEQIAAVGDPQALLRVLLDEQQARRRPRAPAASVANNSCTMSGDRPSDGSSSSRMSGLDISARPIASICCSPPLMVRAIWASAFAQARKQRRAPARAAPLRRRGRASGLAPSSRFSRTVRSPKMPRPSGTSARPASTISCAGSAEMSRPARRTRLPGSVRTTPAMAFRSEVLPAPLAPRIDDDLAAADLQRDAVERAMLAVGDG